MQFCIFFLGNILVTGSLDISTESVTTESTDYTCNDGFRFKETNSATQSIACQADGTWSNVGTCERFACMDQPLDKSTDNINSNASKTLTDHLLDIKIEYKCKDGFFYEDDQSTEKYATCDRVKGSFTYPVPFGKCVESKTCSQKPAGTGSLSVVTNLIQSKFSNDYDSAKTYKNDEIVTYKCKSELDEAFKDTVKVGVIKNICQWDETWSMSEDLLAEHECKLNLCDINKLKDQEANAGALKLETQTHVSFNENGIFKCPESYLRVDDPTTAEFGVLCESTGDFKLPAVWPTCGKASDLILDYSTIRGKTHGSTAILTEKKTLMSRSDSEGEHSGPMTLQDIDMDSDEELQEAFAAGLIQPGLNTVYEKKADRPRINHTVGLKQKLAELAMKRPWIERLDLVNPLAPLAPELAFQQDQHLKAREKVLKQAKVTAGIERDVVHNDFKRELLFYRQAQAAVLEAIPRLKSMGIKTKRPEDYFAQMAKTDEHMQKIREKIVSKQLTEERMDKIRKLRELKKFGKKVQIEVQQKRQKEKTDMLNQVKKFRKGQTDSIDFLKDLEDEGGKKKKGGKNAQKSGPGGGGGPMNNKRMLEKRKVKDKKFGFGGKKKGTKANTKDSVNDVSGFKRFKKPAAGGMKGGAKRLGKARRKADKNKRK